MNNGEVNKSINVIKQNRYKSNSDFFEAKLLLLIDNFKKGKFDQNIKLLYELEAYKEDDNYKYIIYIIKIFIYIKFYECNFMLKMFHIINYDTDLSLSIFSIYMDNFIRNFIT